MKTKIIIPARLESKRFPRKILADVNGKPLLWWTWQRALKVLRIEDVLLAVDDRMVKRIMESYGARVLLTPISCRNGTERIVWAARSIKTDVLINIQADEPVFSLAGVKRLISLFDDRRNVCFGTLAAPINNLRDPHDPNTVKVVLDAKSRALYFSRSLIPLCRDETSLPKELRRGSYMKHIGIYGYKSEFISKAVKLKSSRIEDVERLEQLKYLYHGFEINVIKGNYDSVGVDMPGDLSRVKKLLNRRSDIGVRTEIHPHTKPFDCIDDG